MRTTTVIATALLLAGCAGHRVPRGGETITYATTRCFGACPVYTVTLGPDGQGIFHGERFVAVTGDHRFQATPEQVRAFAARLQTVRPKGEQLLDRGEPGCESSITDQAGVDVRWQVAFGEPSHLHLYYGCPGKAARKIAGVLRDAPSLLPIGDLIRQR